MDTVQVVITVAAIQSELKAATHSFDQKIRCAVEKVDKYLKKGTKKENTSVETKLAEFKECALLFNSACKEMLLAAKKVSRKLALCEPLRSTEAAAQPILHKTEELLQEAKRPDDAKDKTVADLQRQIETIREDAERVQGELQQKLSDALAEVTAKSDECLCVKAESEECREELRVTQSQMALLTDRLGAFERRRSQEFALLERMSNDHEKDIAVWQKKCSQALQEVEYLRTEKENLRGRLVDENLRVQLRDLQQECNRLREENATLRHGENADESPVNDAGMARRGVFGLGLTTTSPEGKNVGTAESPVVVSLEMEKKRLLEQLSVAFEEKLALESELLMLRQRLATAEGKTEQTRRSGECKDAPPSSLVDSAMDEDTNKQHDFPCETRSAGKTASNSGEGSTCGFAATSNSYVGIENEKPPTSCAHSENEDKSRVRELEDYVRQLELQMRDVVTTATMAVDDERKAAEQRLQQEITLHNEVYESQLETLKKCGERQAREAKQAALRCQQLQGELDLLRITTKKDKIAQRDLVSEAERRLSKAEKKIFALSLENEQLRVKERVLRRELENMKAVLGSQLVSAPTPASTLPRQEVKFNRIGGGDVPSNKEQDLHPCLPPNDCSTGITVATATNDAKSDKGSTNGGSQELASTPRGLSAAERLAEVIRQLHERLTALDAEAARVTETYEAEHGESTQRLQQLRAALLYWNRGDDTDNNLNGVSTMEMRRRIEAEIAALVESQRVAQGTITEYYAQAGKKRGELLEALEKAKTMRVTLK
ncbi:hypothetical protein MOQ_000300 [Trypanosoma cruzi marinkellei]|uniref:Uncharacterized protein n=1 Tax=Trypanosoma cruzi marinkellei TaxID=85056 RepID=K2MW55_TRYCR|nr:hypothetical protein MOQ_000300 [Trypanosoma cruzi marinkellei]